MSAIPNNVSYYLRRMSGYSTNTFKLTTLNSTSAEQNSVIEVRIPTNAIVDLKSLTMFADFATADNAAGDHFKCPRWGLSSLIRRVEVLAGGNTVSQGFNEYGLYNAMKSMTEMSYNKLLTKNVLEEGQMALDISAASQGSTRYACPVWHNFIGSASPDFLDTSLVPELILRISLSGNNVQVGRKNGGGVNDDLDSAVAGAYTLSDISFSINTVSMPEVYSEAVLARMNEVGSLEIPFDNIFSFQENISAGGAGSIRFSVSSQSIDEISFAPRLNDTDAAAAQESAYTTAQSAIAGQADGLFSEVPAYFRCNSGNYTAFQTTVNSVMMPQYLIPKADAYQLLQQCKADQYDYDTGDLVNGLNAWLQDCHTPKIRLNHPDDSDRLISGFNSSGTNSIMTIDLTNTSGSAGRALAVTVFVKCKSVLRVGLGRQLQVIV
tara:strand:+ start:9927 stop:11234 length:1308 start_codon:yes stop_codon:yes gene_type:complete